MKLLSKSNFLKGRQCQRRLWLGLNQPPEPAVDPDEVWEMREAEGAAVELHAESLFPGISRIAVGSEEDESREQRHERADLVERTRAALRERRPIAQAYLQSDGLFSITDILEPRGDGWYLWEVKASTSTKPIHDWDLAFQLEVARKAGLAVLGAGVIRLDGNYARGAEIDPTRLLVREDRTVAVTALGPAARAEIDALVRVIDQAAVPAAQPSSRCKASPEGRDGNRPSTCGHLGGTGFCGSKLPAHWVGHLPNLREPKAGRLTSQADQSIASLDPADTSFGWTGDQVRCITAVRSGRPVVDAAALRAELTQLRWPVAYIDFEFDTGMAVPRYPGCRPYDKLPFQWSMLVQERDGGPTVERKPFLHLEASDPRRPFAEALLAALPSEGSIVAHHQSAEIGVLNQIADRLGGTLAAQLGALAPRFFDTETLSKAGYCHADQKGSWSLKKLAPALLGTGYEGLSVQNGLAAVAAWKQASAQTDPGVRGQLRGDLLAYCGRDTSLMHAVVAELREMSKQRP